MCRRHAKSSVFKCNAETLWQGVIICVCCENIHLLGHGKMTLVNIQQNGMDEMFTHFLFLSFSICTPTLILCP